MPNDSINDSNNGTLHFIRRLHHERPVLTG